MKNKSYCVYCHTNKINGKKYIGQTCQNVNERWGTNGSGYRPTSKQKATYFWNAIQKYGWNNFQHEILKSELTLDEANYYEQYYIQEFDTTNRELGYNSRYGGGNGKHTQETKNKMRNSAIKRFMDPKEKEKISLGKTNPSEETRRRYSEWQKGEKSWRYGLKDSPEEIERKRHVQCKCVVAINLITNEETSYYSISEAARQLNLDTSGISKVCRNKISQHKGYYFKYN